MLVGIPNALQLQATTSKIFVRAACLAYVAFIVLNLACVKKQLATMIWYHNNCFQKHPRYFSHGAECGSPESLKKDSRGIA